MAIAFGSPTTWPILMDALSAPIVQASLLPDENIWPRTEEELPTLWPPHDTFLILVVSDFPVDQGMAAGGGTHPLALLVDTQLVATLWNRLGTDQPTRDTNFIKDKTYGIAENWRKILAKLHMATPQDPAGLYITCEPMRCLGWRYTKRDPKLGWGSARATFSLKYIQTLLDS